LFSFAALTLLQCIFALELLLLMLAFMEYFFLHLFYVLDLAIVGLSLGLELGFSTAVNQEIAAVIIFLRMWRLVRAGHGVLTLEGERVNELRLKVRKNAVKFTQLQSDIKEYEFELLALEELLNRNGVRHPNFTRLSRKYHQAADVPHYEGGEALQQEERQMLSDWLDEAATLNQHRVNDQLAVSLKDAGQSQLAAKEKDDCGVESGSYDDYLRWKGRNRN
jgi:hypothetical protein